ncbi:MAG: tetratricopeptide repeat protein [Mogibacterium sp.]|nr:tetratricopeptide repeat protein [Mogibacterium sp.]
MDPTVENTSELMTGNRKKAGKSGAVYIIIAVIAVAIIAGVVGHFALVNKRYNDQVALADKYFTEGDYEQAEVQYAAAVAINPRKVRAREGLAYTMAINKKFDEAGDEYRKLYEDTKDERYLTAEEEVRNGQIPSDLTLCPIPITEPIVVTPPPFAEENHLTFTAAPGTLTLKPTGRAYYAGTDIEALSGTLGAPEVTVSAADADGNVTYTIAFVTNVDTRFSYPTEEFNNLSVNFNAYKPYDYYTGKFFNFDTLHTDGNETASQAEVRGEIEYDGTVIPYSGTHVLDAQWGTPQVTDANGRRTVVWHLTATETYTITVPADYDGLMFGSEYARAALSPEVTEAEGFQYPDYWEGDPAEWIFFRVSELTD